MKLYVTDLVRDEGTIVVFAGFDDYGVDHHFAVDHRLAQALVDGLADPDEVVMVDVGPWQVLGLAH